jgi:hypothetical protein
MHKALAVIDEQPQVELGPLQLGRRQRVEAFANAALATASASMLSDLPRPRASRREDAINLLVTRRTRSPRSIRKRSSEPDTCRQSSIAQTRSAPRPRAQPSRAAEPFAPDCTVCSPSSSPVVAETAAIVWERLCASAPSTIISFVPFHLD